MPKFEITFEREVTMTDQFTRIIEAPTIEAAHAKAHSACDAYDRNCPDDASETPGAHIGDFYVEDVVETDPDAEVDDDAD